MRTNQVVWIECVGIPGVGKTYVAELVQGLLKVQGEVTAGCVGAERVPGFRRVSGKIWRIGRSPQVMGRNTSLVVRRMWRLQNALGGQTLRILFNWIYVLSLMDEARRQEGVWILDQGLFQAMWAVLLSIKPEERERLDISEWLADGLTMMNGVRIITLLIDASNDIVAGRLGSREQRFNRMLKKSERYWEAASEAITRLHRNMEMLQSQGVIRLIRVSNGDNGVDRQRLKEELMLSGVRGCDGLGAVREDPDPGKERGGWWGL